MRLLPLIAFSIITYFMIGKKNLLSILLPHCGFLPNFKEYVYVSSGQAKMTANKKCICHDVSLSAAVFTNVAVAVGAQSG
jgi:hypothetical protein